MDDNKVLEDWERFLTPSILRSKMIIASVYIAAFEILKNSIVERLRDFFSMGWEEGEDIIDPKYQSEVLSRNRSPVYASLQWLEDREAIDETDIATFEKVKVVRNRLAHEISELLAKGLPPELPECLSGIISLLGKVEKWWIVNVDIPTNPDFDGVDIDENEIIPGPIAGLKMMTDIALGTDEEAEYYIKEFKKQGTL